MAKFTVFFNEKPIQSKMFDDGVVHIGRDDTNDIQIDSLAIAPAQAAIIIKDGECTVKQLNENFPIFVNHEKTKEHALKDGDKIAMGKHTVLFSKTESFTSNYSTADKDLELLNRKLAAATSEPEAQLQIMNGKHIGRLIPLKKAMTRIGQSGHGIVVISKRKDGYFISALESHDSLKVNNAPISEASIKLQQNDVIELNSTSMMFSAN